MTIEAPHYEETRQRLMKDPIVIQMAAAINPDDDLQAMGLVHDDGSPTFGMMQRANAEYRKRGGTDGGHIGAIAEAILRLKDE